MKYYKIAADRGNKDAMQKYNELLKRNLNSFEECSNYFQTLEKKKKITL